MFKLVGRQIQRGRIRWEDSSTIGFTLNSIADEPSLELWFSINGQPIRQWIGLSSIPSNLGVGRVWFFICPITGKRCRKLHLIGRAFAHRTAYPGYAYRKQVEPKGFRAVRQALEKAIGIHHQLEELNSPGMKSTYQGKPTKRVKKAILTWMRN